MTVADVKREITTEFMGNADAAAAYGFEVGAAFDDVFSAVSVESIFFYAVAFCSWVTRQLLGTHKAECQDLIERQKPHTGRWYVEKVKAFRKGRALADDTDVYDLGTADPETLKGELIVKHCSYEEVGRSLRIKVAKGDAVKEPLSTAAEDNEKAMLEAYIGEIKDAGVQVGDVAGKVTVVNEQADHFGCEIDVYYDPMVLTPTGVSIADGTEKVLSAVKDYVGNQMPFNSEYTNIGLVSVLKAVAGVEIPDLRVSRTVTHRAFAEATAAGNPVPWVDVKAVVKPLAGYMKVYDDANVELTFIPRGR